MFPLLYHDLFAVHDVQTALSLLYTLASEVVDGTTLYAVVGIDSLDGSGNAVDEEFGTYTSNLRLPDRRGMP